jgi:hypothetical protein
MEDVLSSIDLDINTKGMVGLSTWIFHNTHVAVSLFISFITRTHLKNKISVQGKARNGEKAEHTRSM